MALIAGCWGQAGNVTEGNANLGITELQVNDSKELTTIVGLDAHNHQVAKLELVHGRFVPTDDLGQPPGETVDGRKLSMTIRDQSFTWQTLGYEDTTHMPALSSKQSYIAAFVADEHVRPVLQQWKVGWDEQPAQLAQGDEAKGILTCDLAGMLGTEPVYCGSGSGVQCWIGNDGANDVYTNACMGSANVVGAYSTFYATGDTSNGDNAFAAFCCGNPPPAITGIYAYKSCASKGHCAFNANHQCTTTAECGGDGTCFWSSICGSSTDSQKCIMCNQDAYTSSCAVSAAGRRICNVYN
jgi:hypothetical protein